MLWFGCHIPTHPPTTQALLQQYLKLYRNELPPLLASQPAAKRRRVDAASVQPISTHPIPQYESPPSDASTTSIVLHAPLQKADTPQSRKRSFSSTQQQPALVLPPLLPLSCAARLLPPLLPTLWDGIAHWLPALNLECRSTFALAGFIWKRLRDEVLVHRRALFFTPAHGHSVSDSVLIGCLVVALKLEECRKGAPTVGRVAAACGTTASVVSRLELQVLEACRWRPLAGWAAAQQRITSVCGRERVL